MRVELGEGGWILSLIILPVQYWIVGQEAQSSRVVHLSPRLDGGTGPPRAHVASAAENLVQPF